MSTRVWESGIIPASVERVWGLLRCMEFIYNPLVQSVRNPDNSPISSASLAVGQERLVYYFDGTVQRIRLTGLSDQSHEVSWELCESKPTVPYSGVQWTVALERVSARPEENKKEATFVSWTADFSKDVSHDVMEDARFKAHDHFEALRAEAAKKFSFHSTAEDVAKGHDLKGKTFIVTGGNSGIGYETVRALAKSGGHVVFTARDEKKVAATVAELHKDNAKANVEGMVLALDSFRSIRAFVSAYEKKGYPCHVLINNAGVMACPQGLTEQKFELQFGTNHIGHFLLTTLLLPTLRKSAPARVIVLSSGAHRRADVNWEDPNWTKAGSYDRWRAYGASKSANILFAKQLHLLMEKENSKVSAHSVHPGVIPTNLSRHMTADDKKGFASDTKFVPRYKSIPEGASSTVVAALEPQYGPGNKGGLYFADCNPVKPLAHASNMANAALLWTMTEKMIASVPA
jgi:NAD(P)-dependent dehydrogenase (short-subunit alcohol dehydrogenase family)